MDFDTFIRCVRGSGLVSPERLQRALSQMPPTDRGRVAARALVEQGLLTKFQAERLLAGKTDGFLMGQYRILDEIGRGGMGHVFKAEHMTMGRLVALKILNSQLVKTERARLLFHREVKAAAKLNHPNIVTAFDANQVGERCFLVMEFVDGPNLQDLVKTNGPLPIAQACDYIRQTALGLQYAHEIGMVHRDIKPANLLVQKNASRVGVGASQVKILDFGLARVSNPETGESESGDSIDVTNKTVMGTPDYLSPEQARSLHGVDARTDIYSLGCSLYFLLTGHTPFPGGTAMEKLVRHSTEHARPLNAIRPDVPIEVALIAQKMMGKRVEERFQSAAEVAAVLQPFTGQETQHWIVVEPLPADNVLPVSSRSLPRIPAPVNDPFSNLDSSAYGEETVGTLSGENAATHLMPEQPGYLSRKAKEGNSLLWAAIWILSFLAVVIGLFFAARPQLMKMID
jgi:serine/threonine-protein kinase